MPHYEYIRKDDQLKSVSVIISAHNDADAEDELEGFLAALGVEGSWDTHFNLENVEEDDHSPEEDDPICYCGCPESDHDTAGCNNCTDEDDPCEAFNEDDEA